MKDTDRFRYLIAEYKKQLAFFLLSAFISTVLILSQSFGWNQVTWWCGMVFFSLFGILTRQAYLSKSEKDLVLAEKMEEIEKGVRGE